MSKKLLLPIGIAVLLVILIGVYFSFQRVKWLKEGPAVITPEEQEGREVKVGDVLECNVGFWWTAGGVRYRITGVERHNLEGQILDLCCGEMSEEKQKLKYCWDMIDDNVEHTIMWTANEETGGKFVKTMETYPKDGQQCTRMFDLQGSVTMEGCF